MSPRILLPVLWMLIMSFATVEAQEVMYFETGGFQTIRSKHSPFKRTFEDQGDYLIVKSYSRGALMDSGTYRGFTSLENLNNYFRFHSLSQYYLRSRTDFADKSAQVTHYYRKGDPREMSHYTGDSTAILQVWDEDGQPILKDGQGIREVHHDDSSTTVIRYAQYQEADVYKLRHLQGDTLFLRPDTPARPTEGLKAFNQMLTNELKYPPQALKEGRETTLYVRFIVDETGKLVEFTFSNRKNERYLFEKRTMKKLGKLERWTPAYHKGRPVKTSYGLAIAYRLSD